MSSVHLKVLLVHGAGGGAWEWQMWESEFRSAGYDVHAIDLLPVGGDYSATHFSDYLDQIQLNSDYDILIGASMGGILCLKACEYRSPRALILVCSAISSGFPSTVYGPPYEEVIKWSQGSYESTRSALPDSDEELCRTIWNKWRDESGTVLNEIRGGIDASRPDCPILSIIPGADSTIDPSIQTEFATRLKADSVCYAGMSHVGPLLSRRAPEVARQVISWLRERELDPPFPSNSIL